MNVDTDELAFDTTKIASEKHVLQDATYSETAYASTKAMLKLVNKEHLNMQRKFIQSEKNGTNNIILQ